MQHLRELPLVRRGGHFCPYWAKNWGVSPQIPSEFQFFVPVSQKFGAVASKCDSPFVFVGIQPTVRQTAAKTPFLRKALAQTSARASERKIPNTEGPLPVICVQMAP